MSYDMARNIQKYGRKQATLTGSNITCTFRGPKGKKGYLLDYGFEDLTTTFAGGTNTPKVEVGVSGTLAQFGAAFDAGAAVAPLGMKSVASTYAEGDTTNFGTYMVLRELPADTDIYLTCIVATGGGAAGVADFFARVEWDN